MPGNQPTTVAIYVDAVRYSVANHDLTLGDRGVYTWMLETPLDDLIGNKNQLLKLINGARATGSYKIAAQELRTRLFPPGDDSWDWPATRAFNALSELTMREKPRPVVLLRATTVKNDPVFVPLALLAASDANLLEQRPTVVEPLPRERYGSGSVCISQWALGVPRFLERANGNGTEILIVPSPRMTRYPTERKLIEFLKSAEPQPKGRSEALVLLAHQEGGNLWFTGSGQLERVVPEHYIRRFSPGSIALLSSCSVANPKDDNLQVLRKLNARGIDTIIASPFPIETPYGVALALAFFDSASIAYAKKETPTVLELFEHAVALAASRLEEYGQMTREKALEKSLEFVIVGDPDLRLCLN